MPCKLFAGLDCKSQKYISASVKTAQGMPPTSARMPFTALDASAIFPVLISDLFISLFLSFSSSFHSLSVAIISKISMNTEDRGASRSLHTVDSFRDSFSWLPAKSVRCSSLFHYRESVGDTVLLFRVLSLPIRDVLPPTTTPISTV